MSVLAVEGLGKSFGALRALDAVGFAIAEGERVAMIGPNGAGKTTCFHAIGGQLAADRGTVRFLGEDISRLSAGKRAQRGLARTFQIPALFGSMTVRENVQIALAGGAFGLSRRAHARRGPEADAILAEIGIAELAERLAASLAYGDMKRVELALALALAPKVLLLDEPTAGLGLGEGMALMTQLVRLAAERGFALLFTEHDMKVVFGFAERVLVLAGGRLIADGPPHAVRADAAVQAAYFGAA